MDRRTWKQPVDDRIVVEDLALGASGELRVVDGRGLLVAVTSGAAWITQERDRRDYFLSAGRRLRLDRNGLALVTACGKARLTLSAPLDAAPRWQFTGGRR